MQHYILTLLLLIVLSISSTALRHHKKSECERVLQFNAPLYSNDCPEKTYDAAVKLAHDLRVNKPNSSDLIAACFIQAAKSVGMKGENAGIALYNAGGALHSAGDWKSSISLLKRAAAIDPGVLQDAHIFIGIGLKRLKCFKQAETVLRGTTSPLGRLQLAMVLRLENKLTESEHVLNELGSLCDGTCWREKALVKHDFYRLKPSKPLVEAAFSFFNESAVIHQKMGDYTQAASVLHEMGTFSLELMENDIAYYAFDRAAELHPSSSSYNCLGAILTELNRFEEALVAFEKAIEGNDVHHESINSVVYTASIRQDISVDPRYSTNTGVAKQCGVQPNHHNAAFFNLVHSRHKLGVWRNYYADQALLICLVEGLLEQGVPLLMNPWHALGYNMLSSETIFKITQSHALAIGKGEYKQQYITIVSAENGAKSSKSDRILRIGVMAESRSPSIHGGACAALSQTTSDIYCYSIDGAEFIGCRCTKTRSLAGVQAVAAAESMKSDNLDILIDFMGYTAGNRANIMSLVPCSIQLSWYGYAGSMAAPFIHEFITDRVATPPTLSHHFTESLVYLPFTFFPSTAGQRATEKLNKGAIGLPEKGFLFCCFSQPYKITPVVLDTWAEILNSVENAHLWILDYPGARNIVAEAKKRGMDRVVITPLLNAAYHELTKSNCDLFLDTWPYNAHMVAAETLWAGIPLLTMTSDKFISRVSASLLNSVGGTDMVVQSKREYVEKAVTWARNPSMLNGVLRDAASAPTYNMSEWGSVMDRVFRLLVEKERWIMYITQ